MASKRSRRIRVAGLGGSGMVRGGRQFELRFKTRSLQYQCSQSFSDWQARRGFSFSRLIVPSQNET